MPSHTHHHIILIVLDKLQALVGLILRNYPLAHQALKPGLYLLHAKILQFLLQLDGCNAMILGQLR